MPLLYKATAIAAGATRLFTAATHTPPALSLFCLSRPNRRTLFPPVSEHTFAFRSRTSLQEKVSKPQSAIAADYSPLFTAMASSDVNNKRDGNATAAAADPLPPLPLAHPYTLHYQMVDGMVFPPMIFQSHVDFVREQFPFEDGDVFVSTYPKVQRQPILIVSLSSCDNFVFLQSFHCFRNHFIYRYLFRFDLKFKRVFFPHLPSISVVGDYMGSGHHQEAASCSRRDESDRVCAMDRMFWPTDLS